MPPIVCVTGAHKVGKTTFLEKLIPRLVEKGILVGTVKHDVHGFEMDHEGKDTWRHRRAGAATIAISSPSSVACIRNVDEEMDLEDVVSRYFWAEDLVLAEGYKRSHFPKIEVFRSACEERPLCGPQDNLRALVADDPVQVGDVPVYGLEDASGVADFLYTTFLKDRKTHKLEVRLDGRKLPMKEFVQDFVIGGIVGMLAELRGWKRARNIDVRIRLEDR
jgi:molybdopterin-guanine dinucleotide biosynthesis protein B